MGKKNLQKSSHQARLRDERLQRLQKTPFPQKIHHELIQANRRSHDRRHSRARGAKNLEREGRGRTLQNSKQHFPLQTLLSFRQKELQTLKGLGFGDPEHNIKP
jgi:hypothetical protein